MTVEQQDQAKKLLKAASEILIKCNEGGYVKNVMEVTSIWDGVECDGNCLMEEIGELLTDLN